MNGLSDLIRSFCIVAIAGGIVMLISPEGNVKKYIKFIVSLCVVASLISPVFSISERLPEYLENIESETIKESQDLSKEVYADVALTAKKNIEEEVEELIVLNFNFTKEDVYVVATIDSTDITAVKITDITIFLSDTSCKDDIKDYLSELFLQTVNINIIKKGG